MGKREKRGKKKRRKKRGGKVKKGKRKRKAELWKSGLGDENKQKLWRPDFGEMGTVVNYFPPLCLADSASPL